MIYIRKFKIGDKVTLKNSYEYKGQQDGIGVVTNYMEGTWYNIKWENGSTNTYKEYGILLHNELDKKMLKLKEKLLR